MTMGKKDAQEMLRKDGVENVAQALDEALE